MSDFIYYVNYTGEGAKPKLNLSKRKIQLILILQITVPLTNPNSRAFYCLWISEFVWIRASNMKMVHVQC